MSLISRGTPTPRECRDTDTNPADSANKDTWPQWD